MDRSRAITRKTALDRLDGEFERRLWDGWTPSQKLARRIDVLTSITDVEFGDAWP